MKQLSIRAKLLIFIVIVVLTPVLPGSYIFYQYEKTISDAEEVRQQSADRLAMTHGVIEKFQQQNIAWSNFLLRGHKPELYNTYLRKVYEAERQTYRQAVSLADMLADEPEYSGNISHFLAKLTEMRENYRDALDIYNESDEPHFATDSFLAPVVAGINNQLQAIVQEIEQLERTKIRRLNENIASKKELFLLIVLTTLLFTTLVFFWLFDVNIGKPIASAINTATLISKGKLNTRIDEDSAHEFAVFSKAFNHMIDNLEETNRQLENKVDQLIDEVNQRKTAERKIRAQRQALKESGQLIELAHKKALNASKAKSDFLSRMSHELRTPLNAILGFSQILMTDDLKPNQKSSVNEILTAGEHLLNLINEVLDLSKIENGVLEVTAEAVDIGTLVRETHALVKPLADERHIQIEIDSNSFAVYQVVGDPTRCKEILLNLFSNAIKYGHENGRVWAFCKREADMLVVSICDNGPGIPAERQHEMFQAFNRLDAKGSQVEGTGIGLVISKRLANAMGGNLDFHSTPNKETCFYFSLPEYHKLPHHEATQSQENSRP